MSNFITKKTHPDIYKWLVKYVIIYDNTSYQNFNSKMSEFFTLENGKINVDIWFRLSPKIVEINYPFGTVQNGFDCKNCRKLKSLKNSPEIVNGYYDISNCDSLTSLMYCPKQITHDFYYETTFYHKSNLLTFTKFPEKVGGNIKFISNQFSSNPTTKKAYQLYIAMWLELFESISNEERKKYITNYKDKTDYYDYPIIPIEILKEYGF